MTSTDLGPGEDSKSFRADVSGLWPGMLYITRLGVSKAMAPTPMHLDLGCTAAKQIR